MNQTYIFQVQNLYKWNMHQSFQGWSQPERCKTVLQMEIEAWGFVSIVTSLNAAVNSTIDYDPLNSCMHAASLGSRQWVKVYALWQFVSHILHFAHTLRVWLSHGRGFFY